jgi:hypothetical protein
LKEKSNTLLNWVEQNPIAIDKNKYSIIF